MRIGIDLGGTKIEAVLMAGDGEIIERLRQPTPSSDYSAILDTLVSVIAQLEERAGARCRVGVGMPGTLSPYSGAVKNSNTTVLNGKHLDRDLIARLNRAYRFANDANCFTLSEATDGAAHGKSTVFGVILGTGTGGGIVIDGNILTGRQAIAGEWGHNPLPWASDEEGHGERCYCGRRGCLETYLSGRGLARAYEKITGLVTSAEEVARRCDSGDAAALESLRCYADRLARGLATVINVMDPDIIVLGGGLSNMPLLYELTPAALCKYVFSDYVDTPIVPAAHGDSSGVRGAAWLWSAAS